MCVPLSDTPCCGLGGCCCCWPLRPLLLLLFVFALLLLLLLGAGRGGGIMVEQALEGCSAGRETVSGTESAA